MKSILISIKPRFVADILNGKKTIEIRKTMPKCELPITVYIYCTKDNYLGYLPKYFAGKVVAKFTLNKCQEWHNYSWQEITKNGCVSDNELKEYSKGRKSLYIWHISNLAIYDRPRELCEFRHRKQFMPSGYMIDPLTKAPQSWCYIEVE